MTEIIIVNEKDEIIGYKERGTLDDSDIYRCSVLWIVNSQGDILLAQRSKTKKKHPSMWAAAVAGTNDKGETYESNIIKEAEEEIGLTDFKPIFYDKYEINGDYHFFTKVFYAILDKPIDYFNIDNDEVADIKWFKQDELLKLLKEKPDMFTPEMHFFADHIKKIILNK